MCDTKVEVESSVSTIDMSASLAAITSLVTTLFPNTLEVPQLDHLIANLLQLQAIDGQHIRTNNNNNDVLTSGQPLVDAIEMRRERHRRNERIRHNKIIELIQQLSQIIGLNDRQETQANVLNRSARYVLFLSYVIDKLETDSTDDGIDLLSDEWLQSLYPLYQRAYEEAHNLILNEDKSCGSDVDSLGQSFDQCLPLKG